MRKIKRTVFLIMILALSFFMFDMKAFAVLDGNTSEMDYTKDTVPSCKPIATNEKVGTFYRVSSVKNEVSDDYLFGLNGNIYKVQPNGGYMLFFDSAALPEKPVFIYKPDIDEEDTLYAVSKDNVVYAIDIHGKLLWTFKLIQYIDNTLNVVDKDNILIVMRDALTTQPTKRSKQYLIRLDHYGNQVLKKEIALEAKNVFYDNERRRAYWIAENKTFGSDFLGNDIALTSKVFSKTSSVFYSDQYFNLIFSRENKIINYFKSPEGKDGIKEIELGDTPVGVLSGLDSTYYVYTNGTKLYAINLSDNTIKWTINFPAKPLKNLTNITADGSGNVYACCSDKFIYAYNSDGKLIWKYPVKKVLKLTPVDLGSGLVVLSYFDGSIETVEKPMKPVVIDIRVSQKPVLGEPIGFQAIVGGTAPFTYQWKKDGVNIEGATSIEYIITSLALSDEGRYSVEVTNSLGTTTSPEGEFKIEE